MPLIVGVAGAKTSQDPGLTYPCRVLEDFLVASAGVENIFLEGPKSKKITPKVESATVLP